MTLTPHAAAGAGLAADTPDTTTPLEADLIAAARSGDGRAFDRLVGMHASRVFNYIYHMTRHAQDAEDLAQQTFIKAWRALDRVDTTRPIIAWLLTIARRTALNHFRDTRPWEEFTEATADIAASPAREAEQHDRIDTLWNDARRLLPPRQYEVLWLRFGEELSVEETARVTGLTRTHVKILAFRARHRLIKLGKKEVS